MAGPEAFAILFRWESDSSENQNDSFMECSFMQSSLTGVRLVKDRGLSAATHKRRTGSRR